MTYVNIQNDVYLHLEWMWVVTMKKKTFVEFWWEYFDSLRAVVRLCRKSKPVLDLDVAVVRRALFKTMTDVSRRTPVSFTVQV